MRGRIDAQRYGDDVDEQNREEFQFERDRQALRYFFPHRPPVLEGVAEIEPREVFEPDKVLDVKRLVEAVERTPLGQRLIDRAALVDRNARAAGGLQPSSGHQLGRIAGREVHDEKADQGDAEESRDQKQEALQKIGEHRRQRRIVLQVVEHQLVKGVTVGVPCIGPILPVEGTKTERRRAVARERRVVAPSSRRRPNEAEGDEARDLLRHAGQPTREGWRRVDKAGR